MRCFICIVTFLCSLLAAQQVSAQPPLRKTKKEESKQTGPTLSVRAQTQYEAQPEMPEEVVWKREIYRSLDLKEEKNAALYYPVEPMDNRMNLFTLIFKLMAEDKIPAYEYRLDGIEALTPENRINFRDLLDKFHIYYEEKVEGKRDTILVVDNSDIPSSEVLSYYIKEDWYFDQRSSNYNSRVVAICPVLHRAGDFTTDVTKYPMFWLSYQDLSPYLSRMPVMTSNLNNTANITINDYFTTRHFKGDIYKTTNMLNQTLAQYCPTDSAMVKEQKKIEGQLDAFEKNLWISTRIQPVSPKDSVALAAQATDAKELTSVKNSKKKGRDKSEASAAASSSKSKSKNSEVKQHSSSKSSSAPRVSVRRQRR